MSQVTLAKDLSCLIREWRLTTGELLSFFGHADMSDENLMTTIADASGEELEYFHRLVIIRELVHALYPESHWAQCPRHPNRYFNQRSLIKVIEENPLSGSKEVHTYLMGSIHGGFL